MQLMTDNLPELCRDSVLEDVQAVIGMARDGGGALAGLRLHVIALDQGRFPASMPECQVPTPAAHPPATFEERCDWETQRQSFQILRDGNDLWIIGGGSAGAMYGVSEALECLTGVIWSGMRDEDLLFGPCRALPEGVCKPTMAYRGRDSLPTKEMTEPFLRWMGRNRWNLWRRNSAHWAEATPEFRDLCLRTCAARGIHLTLGDHAIHYFLPEAMFQTHPDWFGMRNGNRCVRAAVPIPDAPLLKAELPIQPCYTNPDVAGFLTDRMAAHMAEYPQVEFFGLWPHDGVNNWCQCPNCLATTPFEQMHRMALRLLEKLPQDKVVELIAYSNLLNPPREPLPKSSRIFTMLCPYLRHYRHRITDPGGPEQPLTGVAYPEPDRINPVDEREYGKLFDIWMAHWRQGGITPAIFEYGVPFYDETLRTCCTRFLYHPPAELMDEEIRWYVRQGVRVFYLCGNFRGWPDGFHEYALGKSLWGDDRSVAERRAHYYDAMAGAGAEPLVAALQRVARELLDEKTPAESLDDLRRAADGTRDPDAAARYRLWADYVALGRQSRDLQLRENYAQAIECEERIDALFKTHFEQLKAHAPMNWMTRLSATWRQRQREMSAGRCGTNYVL